MTVSEGWACSNCHSINVATSSRCYKCAQSRPVEISGGAATPIEGDLTSPVASAFLQPLPTGTPSDSSTASLHPVDRSQLWRVQSGDIPNCPVDTLVMLTRSGDSLEVLRPWAGVAARLDMRLAIVSNSNGADGLVIRTGGAEVRLTKHAGHPAGPPDSIVQPEVATLVGKAVQFMGKVKARDGVKDLTILVVSAANGWVLGLTQTGRPAGIAEANILWARVVDPGPYSPPDPLIRTYWGSGEQCNHAFQAEAPTLGQLGYFPITQSVDGGHVHAGRLLLTAGASVFVGRSGIRSEGNLTVTFRRTQMTPGSMDPTRPCPRCAETIKAAAIMCRFCGLDLLAGQPSIGK